MIHISHVNTDIEDQLSESDTHHFVAGSVVCTCIDSPLKVWLLCSFRSEAWHSNERIFLGKFALSIQK